MSKPEVERQKSPNLGFWGRIGLESLWIFCKFFSILPYWFRYYVVEPAVFGALRLLRYRYRVVTENLRNSFPEKSLEELHAIRRVFYRTLAEIFVDTFSLAGLTDEKCRQVVVVKDLEKQMAAVEGRDWIALTAHLGCWEYCSFWGYDLFRRRGEAGAALRSARILLLAAACQTGLLRDGFRPDLRRRRGGGSP